MQVKPTNDNLPVAIVLVYRVDAVESNVVDDKLNFSYCVVATYYGLVVSFTVRMLINQ